MHFLGRICVFVWDKVEDGTQPVENRNSII